jgi:hypothetical protein
MSVGRSASFGYGVNGSDESVRSIPTRRLISVSASRPIRSMVCSTSRVEPSPEPSTRRSAPACITIIDTLCATASCNSLAILARSSTTASRAATSRSRSASADTAEVDPRTCLDVISQPGTYQITAGTGRYAGISGDGTYQLSLIFVAGRSHGQCSSAKPPVARQELLRLSGPVRL